MRQRPKKKDIATDFVEKVATDSVNHPRNLARNYKNLGIRFNKYEWDILKKLAEHQNKSLLMTVRECICEVAIKESLI